jgi:predicted ArsR family transcriptional regulator
MGRPSFIYDLTAGASNAFPQSYAAFATGILQDLAELNGHEKLDQLFQRHYEKRRQRYRSQVGGETLSDRVASLARVLEDEGRMTTWEQFGERQFILREHNCPILQVAEIFDQTCQCEIDLFRELLQARITRVGHIPDGDIACVYEIEAQDNYHTAEQSSEAARPAEAIKA